MQVNVNRGQTFTVARIYKIADKHFGGTDNVMER